MPETHSREIQINIKGTIPLRVIEDILRRPDSGVELRDSNSYDLRKPLYSGPGEMLTLLAVIVNIARLALSIHELLKQKPLPPKPAAPPAEKVEVFLLVQNRIILLSGGTPEEIEATLRKELSPED